MGRWVCYRDLDTIGSLRADQLRRHKRRCCKELPASARKDFFVAIDAGEDDLSRMSNRELRAHRNALADYAIPFGSRAAAAS